MTAQFSNSPKARKRTSLAGWLVLVMVLLLGWRFARGPEDPTSKGLAPIEDEARAEAARAGELEVLPKALSREPEKALVAEPSAPESMDARSADAEDAGRLTGSVFDVTGAALEDAWVWLLLDNGDRSNAQSDSDGAYVLEGIPFGQRLVNASSLHHHDDQLTLLFSAQSAQHTHDFVLRGEQRIRVRLVTSTGEPALEALARAQIATSDWNLVPVATRDEPGRTYDGVQGSLNNRFGIGSFWQSGFQGLAALTPDEIGTVSLHEEGPAWLSLVAAHQVVRKKVVDASTESVTFVIDPRDFTSLYASVRGQLVEGETGAPLPGFCALSENAFLSRNPLATEQDGSFLRADELPGKRYLIVAAAGRASLVLPLSLAAGEQLDLGQLALYSPVELSGRCVNAKGEPLEAVLKWGRLDLSSGKVDWVKQRKALSDAAGEFKLSGLEPGVWILRSPGLSARAPRPYDERMAAGCLRVDARDGSVANLELVLHDTGTVMLVAEDVREPWPIARAIDAAGLPAGSAWIGRWGVETALRLPPGAYTLIISREEVELERHSISVGSQPRRLEFNFAD